MTDPTPSAIFLPMPKLTDAELTNFFTDHSPTEDQQARYRVIRYAALEFARVLVAHCPASADTTVAIRKLRECVQIANASIALEPPE